MMSGETKLGKLRARWSEEGTVGLARWITYWSLWNTPLHRVLSTEYLEESESSYRFSKRVKKYGIAEPIIVYPMPKVGSYSMYVSLNALGLNVPVYHVHFLNDADDTEEWARQTLHDPDGVLKMVTLSRRLKNEMDRGRAPRYNLISLVRAPEPRNLSAYFHNVDSYIPNLAERLENHTITARDVAEDYLNSFTDPTPNRWFERQVRDVFGIDVYAQPFAREKGYQIYENAQARLLLLRLEDLNRVAGPALQEFLNIPDFTLLRANVGEDKTFGVLYKELTAILRLPPERIKESHSTRYARHFYTPEELEASVARWV